MFIDSVIENSTWTRGASDDRANDEEIDIRYKMIMFILLLLLLYWEQKKKKRLQIYFMALFIIDNIVKRIDRKYEK